MDDVALGALLVQLVASASGLEGSALQSRDRDPQLDRGRQVLFYLAHVGLGWPLERTGRRFGRRRSTISHACRQVEDRRDQPALDASLERLEELARALATASLDLR